MIGIGLGERQLHDRPVGSGDICCNRHCPDHTLGLGSTGRAAGGDCTGGGAGGRLPMALHPHAAAVLLHWYQYLVRGSTSDHHSACMRPHCFRCPSPPSTHTYTHLARRPPERVRSKYIYVYTMISNHNCVSDTPTIYITTPWSSFSLRHPSRQRAAPGLPTVRGVQTAFPR